MIEAKEAKIQENAIALKINETYSVIKALSTTLHILINIKT